MNGGPPTTASFRSEDIGPLPLVAIPWGIIHCFHVLREEFAKKLPHKDYAFVWTTPYDLPSEARKYFEQRMPELEELEFTLDGYYLMKPQYENYYGALLLSKSGTTVASLICLYGECCCSFNSILEGGRMLETTSAEPVGSLASFEENPRYTAQFVTDLTIAASYQRHREKLGKLFWTTGERVLPFTAAQVCDVLQYAGRLFSQQLHQLDQQHGTPPDPVLPAALPIREEGGLFPEPTFVPPDAEQTEPPSNG